MTAEEEGRELLRRMHGARGYLLPLHSVLAEEDATALAAYEEMMEALYHAERRLDARTKELIYVSVLVALGAAEDHVRAHMERARREGASPEELLEALELLIPAAGVARASVGFDIWRSTFRSSGASG